MKYWKMDPNILSQKYTAICAKHYPIRRPPRKWPDMKLIGKAIVRGWAIPCRYYPIRRGGGVCIPFVFAGISDHEYWFIHTLMKREDKKC